MKALVAGDLHMMRKIIGGVLHEEGLEILEAADGEETLDLLKSSKLGKVDLVTIDWNMPVTDGSELVVNIQAEKNLRNIALMMVAIELKYSQVVHALAAGAHEYLIKPLTQEAISKKLLLLGLSS